MDVKEALDEAVVTSFGDMAFMDAVPEISCGEEVAAGQLVYIEFAHPLKGFLTLHMPRITKQRLTENIHGRCWDELAGSDVDDCLMELANVVAGNFLLRIGDEEYRHAVSLPQVLYDEQDLPAEPEARSWYYRVDDVLVRVTVAYGKEARSA